MIIIVNIIINIIIFYYYYCQHYCVSFVTAIIYCRYCRYVSCQIIAIMIVAVNKNLTGI